MKKKYYILITIFILIIIILSFLIIFNKQTYNKCKYKNSIIVSKDKNYEVYRDKDLNYCYNIYDNEHKLIRSENLKTRNVDIEYINKKILKIKINYGVNATINIFYDVNNNIFSKNFQGVISQNEDFIAYLKAYNNNVILVIQNMFDKNKFYREFDMNISIKDVLSKVTNAYFNEDKFYLSYIDENNNDRMLVIKYLE